MPGELGDELLAHHPRGAKHSDVDPLHGLLSPSRLPYGRNFSCAPVGRTESSAGVRSALLLDTVSRKKKPPTGWCRVGGCLCSLVDLL